jgi:hypothetical protein
MVQALGEGPGMLSIRLRGWLVRYIWPSYAQRTFIDGARRDIRRLVQGGSELSGR